MQGVRRFTALLAAGVLLACGGSDEPAGEAGSGAAPPQDEQAAPPVLTMNDHYGSVQVAHDALARGDLDAYRSALAILPVLALPADSPEAWLPLHAELQEAAAAGAESDDLEAVGRTFSEVIRRCAGCHEALGSGPGPRSEGPEVIGHVAAAASMWEGVTAPSDEAWTRGASALAQAEIFDAEAVYVLRMREDNLRTIGEAAAQTRAVASRALIYARLAASCSGCHEAAGIAAPTSE